MARIGVSVCPLIMMLEDVWVLLPSTLFSLVAVTAALSASFLPETKNVRLPETIEDVEQTKYSARIYFQLSPNILSESYTWQSVNVFLLFLQKTICSNLWCEIDTIKVFLIENNSFRQFRPRVVALALHSQWWYLKKNIVKKCNN